MEKNVIDINEYTKKLLQERLEKFKVRLNS